MSELMVFDNPEYGEVRTLEENGTVLFCGTDIARALGYAKPQSAVATHCRGSLKRGVPHPQNPEKTMEMTFIAEPDLYRLVFRSTLPSAEKFTDWVVSEVLPTIRKTGSYTRQLAPMTPAEMLAAQAQLMVDMERRIDTVEAKAEEAISKLDTAIKVYSTPSKDHWRDDINAAINLMVEEQRQSPREFRGRLYKELETTARCDINARLAKLRGRLRKQGATSTTVKALTKLDAIAADDKLRAIFAGIVKAHQAQGAGRLLA